MSGRSSKSIRWHLSRGAKKAAANPKKLEEAVVQSEEFLKQAKAAVTRKRLKQLFENKSNCYADTTDESVVLAMDAERFVEVVSKLLDEGLPE